MLRFVGRHITSLARVPGVKRRGDLGAAVIDTFQAHGDSPSRVATATFHDRHAAFMKAAAQLRFCRRNDIERLAGCARDTHRLVCRLTDRRQHRRREADVEGVERSPFRKAQWLRWRLNLAAHAFRGNTTRNNRHGLRDEPPARKHEDLPGPH